MPGPKPDPIGLTPRQRSILEHLVRRQKSAQLLVQRVNILLAADLGATNNQIAAQLGLDRNTVGRWRKRWALATESFALVEAAETDKSLTNQIMDLLGDAPRCGTPPTFSAQQICQMVALACEDPNASGRPISHWTPRELADESVLRGIVAQISPRHMGRFLKSTRPETASESLLAERESGGP